MTWKSLGLAVLTAALLAVTPGVVTPADAQDASAESLSLVVPWPAGGGSDIIMRMVADAATITFGKPVMVINRPGGAGSVGLRDVAQAAPDGSMVGMIASGFVAQQYSNPLANEIGDFAYVAYVGTDPAALAVSTTSGLGTLDDLIKTSTAAPGSVRNGNGPPVDSSFLSTALIERNLGIKLNKVPYQGYIFIVQALLAQEVQTGIVTVPDVRDHRPPNGTVDILAVAGEERHPLAPDVPTFRELGHDLVTGTLRAIVAPKGTPPEVMAKLETGFLTAMQSPAFVERARAAGFSVNPKGGKEALEVVTAMDRDLYPILLEAGFVRTRTKP